MQSTLYGKINVRLKLLLMSSYPVRCFVVLTCCQTCSKALGWTGCAWVGETLLGSPWLGQLTALEMQVRAAWCKIQNSACGSPSLQLTHNFRNLMDLPENSSERTTQSLRWVTFSCSEMLLGKATYSVNHRSFCPRGLETSVTKLRVLELLCKEFFVVVIVMLILACWSPFSCSPLTSSKTILVTSRWEWQTHLSSEMFSISSSHRHGLSPIPAFPSLPLLNSGLKLFWSVTSMEVALSQPAS